MRPASRLAMRPWSILTATVLLVLASTSCQSAGGNTAARMIRESDQAASYSSTYTISTAAEFDISARNGEKVRPSSSTSEDADDPADTIARAVCEKRLACGVATSVRSCTSEVKRHAHHALQALDCENGVRPDGIARCTSTLSSRPCAEPRDAVGAAGCRREDLCM